MLGQGPQLGFPSVYDTVKALQNNTQFRAGYLGKKTDNSLTVSCMSALTPAEA